MGAKEQREHQRFKIADQSMHAKIASAKMVEILDISIGGMLLQTDMRLNISKEYTIQIEHNKKHYSLKGSIVWSVLKESKNDQLGNSIPIYRSGIQFLHVPEEMVRIILLIGTNHKHQNNDARNSEEYYPISIDTLDISKAHANMVAFGGSMIQPACRKPLTRTFRLRSYTCPISSTHP